MQHADEPPLSLAHTVPGLPDEMVQLVDAMLAKTPEARPSLAAVRAVIKRLRTTKLPTRSVAGQQMASFAQLPAELGVTASHVGAEAVVPSIAMQLAASPAAISQPATTTPGVGIERMRPPTPTPARMAPAAAAQPQPRRSHPGSQHPRSGPLPRPGVPSAEPPPPVRTPDVQSSQPLPPTQLGVAPPHTSAAGQSARAPVAPTRPRRRWLVLACLLVLASALGLAAAFLFT
jgi:hypothetical protein